MPNNSLYKQDVKLVINNMRPLTFSFCKDGYLPNRLNDKVLPIADKNNTLNYPFTDVNVAMFANFAMSRN